MLRDAWDNHPGMLLLTGVLGTLGGATLLLATAGVQPSRVLSLDDGVLLLAIVALLFVAPWCVPGLAVLTLGGLLRTWPTLSRPVRLWSVVILLVALPATGVAWTPMWSMLRVGLLD